eukprot:scaffold1640_cov161-Amphora_coffeaeformis.AAC.39
MDDSTWRDVVKPSRATVLHWIDHPWNRINLRSIINTWAHIKFAENVASPVEEEEDYPGYFLPNSDPREEDILALYDSAEMSSDEEE